MLDPTRSSYELKTLVFENLHYEMEDEKSFLEDVYKRQIMVHLYNANLPSPTLQGLASYMYEFHGKAAHASAAPWEGNNAFNAAQLMFHAVDMLRQHTTPDAQFHGIIRNGGEAPNIVPEKVTAELYIRALDKKYLQDLIQKVDNCAEGRCV